MPVLQRDLERLVANTRAADALAADALARLAALKIAQEELRLAWARYKNDKFAYDEFYLAIKHILEV